MKIQIDASVSRVQVNPGMYGIFFEEINHAGDGGIYAELVQNRDFEANTPPVGTNFCGNWLMTPQGSIERKWFKTDLPGWSLIAEGRARGAIRQVDSPHRNAQSPPATVGTEGRL